MASKLATAIVKRQRDLPILLQVALARPHFNCRSSDPMRSLWYVIEEKPSAKEVDKGETEILNRKWPQSTTTASSLFNKGGIRGKDMSFLPDGVGRMALPTPAFREGKGISTVAHGIGVGVGNQEISTCRDTIRRLPLHGARFRPNHLSGLLAFNSHLYFVGGDFEELIRFGTQRPKSGVFRFRYLDLEGQGEKRWQRQDGDGGFLVDQIAFTAARNDGWFYVGTEDEILVVHPLTGRYEELPFMPKRFYFGGARLVGVAQNKLFVYTTRYGNVILCYDPESRTWEAVDGGRKFLGGWSHSGVALYNDRYFFVYSTRNPIKEDEDVPGIYVFDIEREEWLPSRVEGLDENDEYVITIFDSLDRIRRAPYLVRIGTDDDNNPKLALVWQPSAPCGSVGRKVRWSKFTIHLIINGNPSGSGQPLCFRAQLVSNGEHQLSKKSSAVLNCLEIGAAKGMKEYDHLEGEGNEEQ